MANCVECGHAYSTRREALGYRTCLDCGEIQARAVTFTVAPINKSNYMLISNSAELAQLNPKRTG